MESISHPRTCKPYSSLALDLVHLVLRRYGCVVEYWVAVVEDSLNEGGSGETEGVECCENWAGEGGVLLGEGGEIRG